MSSSTNNTNSKINNTTSNTIDSDSHSPVLSQQRRIERDTTGIETQDEPSSLTDCLLSQYRLCAAGVAGGTAYSLKYKKGSLLPMLAAGTVGSIGDLVYGYLVECSQFTKKENDNERNAS